MPKWLRWPSDRQIVFLLVCGLVTALLVVDLDIKLRDSIYLFWIVVFVALLVVGWYDKLWKLLSVGFIVYVLVWLFDALYGFNDLYLVDLDSIFNIMWLFFIFFLWFVPYQIKKNARSFAESNQKEPSPRFKLSELFTFFWFSFWGLLLLVVSVFVLSDLYDLPGFGSGGEAFRSRYQDWFFLLRSIDFAIWVPIALLLFVDMFRKDGRLFYSGVGLFSVWQFSKLLVFYFTPYPVQAYTETLVLVLLLLGGSLLLRAAWNRPSPEALEGL